tara:strand:- start:10933 stop:11211 length:279 start_codon:yes stop_codon:yes gene_type:complete
MKNDESIKETLDVIRKALNDDYSEFEKDILVLNRKVNKDGTINKINNDSLNSSDVHKIIEEKLILIVEKKFDQWFEKRLPEIINKFITSKEK